MNRHQRRAWKRQVRGMNLHIEIDLKTTKTVDRDGKKVKEKVKETRIFDRDLEDLPLILFAVVENENIEDMRLALADFLDLNEEEGRQITLRHVRQVTTAITEAKDIPNG